MNVISTGIFGQKIWIRDKITVPQLNYFLSRTNSYLKFTVFLLGFRNRLAKFTLGLWVGPFKAPIPSGKV